jgi:glycosyltransferase involved in cell wall biosynthesis
VTGIAQTPALTVGITCYREGRLLQEAIDSVLAQTFTAFECIVVNDASPHEETNRICDYIESLRDPRVKVVRRSQNGGLSAARNTVVETAVSDWVVPLDADDLLPPRALQVIAGAIAANPAAGFILGAQQAFGRYEALVDPRHLSRHEILLRQCIPGASPFCKTTWNAVGGFDLVLSYGNQDWDFWMGVMEKGIGWQYVPEVTYLYRTRENSMCQSYGLRWPQVVEYMFEKHRAFFTEYGVRGQFLAQGYRRGAFAAYALGDLCRARRWAWRAMLLGDVSRPMGSIFLRSLFRRPAKG